MNIRLISHALIIDEHGKVLILRRSKDEDVLPLVWDIPGGGCEPGEDPKDTAIRETMEEAGIKIDDLHLLAHTSNTNDAKDMQFVRFIFLARYQGGAIRLSPREHEAFAWINPTAPEQAPLVDYLPQVLKLWMMRKNGDA